MNSGFHFDTHPHPHTRTGSHPVARVGDYIIKIDVFKPGASPHDLVVQTLTLMEERESKNKKIINMP